MNPLFECRPQIFYIIIQKQHYCLQLIGVPTDTDEPNTTVIAPGSVLTPIGAKMLNTSVPVARPVRHGQHLLYHEEMSG